MAAFLGISLWIALATVVPGLVTIATVYGAAILISPDSFRIYLTDLKEVNEWVYSGIAITMMVMTQALGILLERVLINRQWLGPAERRVQIPEGIDPRGYTDFPLKPYLEYKGLYLLLAELREHDDSQGHLQRALAQFFLTNNTVISYTAGIVAALLILWQAECADMTKGAIYIGVMGACLVVSFTVARIRFEVMTKALWAARRNRTPPAAEE